MNRHKQAELGWKRNFKDNVAIMVSPNVIHYRNPNGSSTFSTHLRIDGPRLFVYGDINDAIFRWPEKLTWDFLSNCGFSYMAGKCCCMEHSERGMTWDADVAKENMLDRIGQLIEDHFFDEEDFKLDPSKIELDYGYEDALQSANALYYHGDIDFKYNGAYLKKKDGKYLSWTPHHEDYDIGETYDWGMYGAYYALQWSLEQLKIGEYADQV